MGAVTLGELRQMQGLPLELKVLKSIQRIREWYDHWDGNVYVSFSGGKDSTVLLHLVRSIYPEVPAVFVNTGLEYPEIVSFVKETENVTILRPKMAFPQVIEKYGWPVVSKRIATYIHQVIVAKSPHTRRLRLEGIRKDGSYSPMAKIGMKWRGLLDAPFRVSGQCCHVMKRQPFALYERAGRKAFVGMMAADSKVREVEYTQHGCNAFDMKTYPRSAPMSFWLESDVWEYIKTRNVPYSPIYDMGYTRTGCMFCCFGLHMEEHPNRFERMAVTHPKLYDYCMDKLGLGKVLDYMGIKIQPQFAEMNKREERQ